MYYDVCLESLNLNDWVNLHAMSVEFKYDKNLW